MYKTTEENKKIYVTEKRTDKDIYQFEYFKSENGWWVTKYHYNVQSPFAKKTEIFLPDEVIDVITSYNAKEKLLQS